MFLTWQIWNAIRFPKRQHPIFIQARKVPITEFESSLLWRWRGLIAIAFIVILVLILPVPPILTFVALITGIPLMLIVFNGTMVGIVLLTLAGTKIASTRRSNRFELMNISTEGGMTVCWLLATGVIHRDNWSKTVYRLVKSVVLITLVLLGLASLMLLIGSVNGASQTIRQQQLSVLRDVINISLLVGALWLDHIQSVVVAVTMGMFLPLVIRDEVRLGAFAPNLFLMIQVCTYLATFVVYRLISIVLSGMPVNNFVLSVAITALSILSLYLVREAIIGTLWRLILKHYDASIDEYQRLMNS